MLTEREPYFITRDGIPHRVRRYVVQRGNEGPRTAVRGREVLGREVLGREVLGREVFAAGVSACRGMTVWAAAQTARSGNVMPLSCGYVDLTC